MLSPSFHLTCLYVGDSGDDGTDGVPGEDGRDGVPGEDGTDGSPGPKGRQLIWQRSSLKNNRLCKRLLPL